MIPGALRRNINDPSTIASATTERRGIPFDYAFRYTLTGQPGNVINSVVTVSIEATFTAVSIGYGVIPDVQRIIFGPTTAGVGGKGLINIPLREILTGLTAHLTAARTTLRGETGPEAVFKNGFRLNPDVAELALQNAGQVSLGDSVTQRLFQVTGAPPELIQFKYAIFDEGSGREFQSEPILNIAGLGSADGDRPFRYFAQPIVFRPKSTIRMEVTEVSDFKGELHVSLHGYKVLGELNSPTGAIQRR